MKELRSVKDGGENLQWIYKFRNCEHRKSYASMSYSHFYVPVLDKLAKRSLILREQRLQRQFKLIVGIGVRG